MVTMIKKISYGGAWFKTVCTGLCLAAATFMGSVAAQADREEVFKDGGLAGRKTLNFNRDWKFQLGDVPGGEASGLDDSRWERVGLPHSFSIPYFLSPDS